MDLEDIFSPLRGEVSLADSTHSGSSVGTPVMGQQSFEKLLQKKVRVSEDRDTFSQTTVELDIPEGKSTGLKTKPSLSSCGSIGEEDVFPKVEERRGDQSDLKKEVKRKVKMSLNLDPVRPHSPKRDVSSRVSGKSIAEEKGGKKKKETEDSTKREERRKSRNKESEEHCLKNQMLSTEKSVRLAVSMEIDSLRTLILDQQVMLHRKLDRILEESQRTQQTNAYLLSVIEKQNEVQQKLLAALLSRNNKHS